MNIIKLLKTNKEIIMYLIVGVLTTAINFIIYFIFRKIFHVDYIISNLISWILAVAFAFIPNKFLVFGSKHLGFIHTLREFLLFVFYRLVSLGIDMLLMIIFISLINEVYLKFFVQIAVIIINYILSKFFIFSKKKKIS